MDETIAYGTKLIALNTVYKKTLQKQTTYRTSKGVEKELDYVLGCRGKRHDPHGK